MRRNGWMTSVEVAVYLGCTVKYLQKLRKMRALPFAKIDRVCLYRRRDVELYKLTHPRVGQSRRAS